MIRTRRGERAVLRGDLEDGSSQSRSQFRSSNSQSRNLVHNIPHQIQGSNNFRNNVMSFVDLQFQPSNLQEKYSAGDTSSSENEDEEFFRFSRLRLPRPHSDYETGESSDRPTRADMTKKIQQKHDPTNSQVLDSDSSSDDSVLSPRIAKNLKRPISPTTTSDSSDSGIPIASRRPIKRMRVFSNSEGSGSGSLSDANDQNLRPDESDESEHDINKTENVNPAQSQLAGNSTQEDGESSVVLSGPGVQSSRGRSSVIDSESESDIELTNHTIRGRRVPVIESEDDSGSLVEYTGRRSSRAVPSSVQSIGQRVSSVLGVHGMRRRRRNALPPQGSERGPTINVADSFLSNHNVRRRKVVSSNIINSESVGQNVWRVTVQAEETEDNDVPILNRRIVRGRRIPVVESEENSESDSDNNDEISIPEGGSEVVNSFGSDVINVRRRRNIPLIQSEEESSNSDSDIRPRTLPNRVTPIFQSDDSSSTSSSSSTDSDDSIPIRHPRHSNNRPIPIVDNFEDIANNFNEFDVNIKASTVIKVFADHDGQSGNSDTDGESDKCPICLAGFKLQEIGKPKSCDHKFCSLCIKEWATKKNTCPVDRIVFDGIVVYDKIEGKIISEVPIVKPNEQNDHEAAFGRIEEIVAELFTDSSDDSSWYFDDSDGDGPEEICSICGGSNQPHRMISCDSCGIVCHLGCVNPPLRDFPTIYWYCPHCDNETDVISDSD